MTAGHVGPKELRVRQPVHGQDYFGTVIAANIGVQSNYEPGPPGNVQGADWKLIRPDPARVGFNNRYEERLEEGYLTTNKDYCVQGGLTGVMNVQMNSIELIIWDDGREQSRNWVSIPCIAQKGDSGGWLFHGKQVCGILIGGDDFQGRWVIYADMKSTLDDIALRLNVDRRSIRIAE